MISLGEGGPKGGGHIGEGILRARLIRQVLIITEIILQKGTIMQKKKANVRRSVVIREKGNLDLGAVSTESKRKTDGPQSWNSTFSESTILVGLSLAWWTRALIPSAPRDSAPPIAIYLRPPLVAFRIFSLFESLFIDPGEGLLNSLLTDLGITLIFEWLSLGLSYLNEGVLVEVILSLRVEDLHNLGEEYRPLPRRTVQGLAGCSWGEACLRDRAGAWRGSQLQSRG